MSNKYLYPHDHIWGVVLAIFGLRAILAHFIVPLLGMDQDWFVIQGWLAIDPNYIWSFSFFLVVLAIWRTVVKKFNVRTELGEVLNHVCLLVITLYLMVIAPSPLF